MVQPDLDWSNCELSCSEPPSRYSQLVTITVETTEPIEKPPGHLDSLFTRWVDGKAIEGSLQSAMQLDGEDDKFMFLVVSPCRSCGRLVSHCATASV